jgi:hypothetical protein
LLQRFVFCLQRLGMAFEGVRERAVHTLHVRRTFM